MDLSRFTKAHEMDYEQALAEVRRGRKTSHWMWYIFPQIAGLGRSGTAQYYAITDAAEARAYLSNDILGAHMREIVEALLTLETNDPVAVFGSIDALKLRSSMTLFAMVCTDCPGWDDNPFDAVLAKFYDSERDELTIGLLA